MQNSQTKKSPALSSYNAKIFIDYKPAELCIKTQWLVVYYAKNPATQLLERFRICVPTCKIRAERIKMGKVIVSEVNLKLKEGWLPFYDTLDSNDFKPFEFCTDLFLKQTATNTLFGLDIL